MQILWSDLRYACRTLARTPGFAAVAIGTLALGIGANTAIFSIFDSVLLRPLPYPDPSRLVAIQERVPKFANAGPALPVSGYHFREWRAHSRSFESMALFGEISLNLTTGGDPERIPTDRISPSLFPMLGLRPQVGRLFAESEDKPGSDRVAILSDALWTRRFQRDPAIVGRKIVLDGNPYEVVGVLPAGFHMPRINQLQELNLGRAEPELWKPMGLKDDELSTMGDFDYGCIARLRHGTGLPQALADLNAVQEQIDRTFPERTNLQASIVPLQQQLTGGSRQSLVLLLAAVGVVLAIICVNLANLLLARATGRRRELAIRAAIGAGMGRLLRQMLTETLLLAGTGGALGILLAGWGVAAIVRSAPVDLANLQSAQIDLRVALFAAALSLICGIVFGALPAWRLAHTDPQTVLRSGGRGATDGRGTGRARSLLIGAEVALSAVCLVIAGLLLHSFVRLLAVDKGFTTERGMSVVLNLPATRYPDSPHRIAFVRDVIERIQRRPGVTAVGVSNLLPLNGEGSNNLVLAEGLSIPIMERPLADMRSVNPGYFRALGIPLLSGRNFTESDGDRLVALASASAARRLWPNANAVGKRFHLGGEGTPLVEVVGVVGDVRAAGLQKDPNLTIYRPYWQRPRLEVSLVVRAAVDPLRLSGAIRREIRALDPELPVPAFRPLEHLVDSSVEQRRFQMSLVLLFAAAALLLAAVGVYGVVAQSVSQRTNEIGIRVALGASRSQVWHLVLRQGLTPVVAGLAAGAMGAIAAARLIQGMLFGVPAADPLTFTVVAGVLMGAALAACYLPARRATRVAPNIALRYE